MPARLDLTLLARLSRPVLFAAIPALASLVLFVELPSRPMILHVIEKLGHPGVFALIALCCMVLQLDRRPRAPPVRDYLLAFLVCVAIGAATELGQMFTHRHPSLTDVGLDARGAVCALLFAAAFDRRVWDRPGASPWRWVCGLSSGALALVIAAPLLYAGAAYLDRARSYPALFLPRSTLSLYFLEAGSAPFELLPPAAGAPAALRVPLAAHPYDGVGLEEPSPDWRGQHTLLIDVTNPGRSDLELAVRIDDEAHTGRYEDRYNGEFRIAAGTRRVLAIPLAAIEAAPRGRRIDLGHIARVLLFRTGEAGPSEFLLNAVVLR